MQRTSVRLGLFALVLAGTFGTAYAIGEKLPGHHHGSGVHSPSHAGHAGSIVTVAFTVVVP